MFTALALISSFSLSCAGTPPPPPKPVAKVLEVAPPPPPPPPLAPSRWVHAGGATVLGPKLEAGTLVLVGGRRALVAKDGTVKNESVTSPEPLEEIIEVPLAAGGKRLVARGTRGLYRLEDPLGALIPLASSEQDIRGMGAYAGHVVLWIYGADVPRFVDVETGRLKTMTTLPPLPMRSVAFRDAKEGAAIFEGVGLATTTDGGASWKRVSDEVGGDAMRVSEVELREGSLRAFIYDDGRDAPVDVVQARLGRIADQAPPAEGAPLERWVRATHRDPLAAAAATGVLLPGGNALVASHGMLARVDTTTGLVTSTTEFARGLGVGACTMGRAGADAWVACAVTTDTNSDFYDPFGVMRVSLDGKELKADKPSLVRNGEVELRTSMSGGVMLLGPCTSDDEGDVCARQPDGRWLTMRGEVDLFPRGAGPLSDGRVAFVRNMWEGDMPQEARSDDGEEAPDEAAEGAEGEGQPRGEGADEADIPDNLRVYVAALSEGNKEERLATLSFRTSGELRVQSAIEEDAEHALHFVLADDEGVYAVVAPVGGPARVPQRLEGATAARIRGGRGIAVGEENISASTDGGRTWQSLPLPERVRSSLSDVSSLLDDPAVFGASEVGVMLDKNLRLGWGAAEASEDKPAATFGVTIPPSVTSQSPLPEKFLSCTSEASLPGTPPLQNSSGVATLLGKKGAPAKGTRRAASTAPMGRNGLLDVVALFEEEGSDKPGSEPTKWTLSWHDAAELGGKPRSWSGAPPKGVGFGTQLRWAAGSGSRALFTLRVGSKNLLVRTKGAGIETAEVGYDLMPSSEIVFGAEKGEPIVWLRDTSLIVWVSGEKPRIIGHVSSRSGRLIGEPTKDGVPVLIGSYDWSAMRYFAIPAFDKKATVPFVAPAPTLEGWTMVPNIRQTISKLPICATKPKPGPRFFVMRGFGRATMDNATGSLASALYDVRLSGMDACVAQVSTLFTADRSGSKAPPPPPAKGAKPATPKGPIAFVRADFLGKRAEGGERGMPGKDMVRKMVCGLEEKK